MDALDLKLIDALQRDGRASFSDLAALLDLSGPAVADRVRKLESRGVIRGFGARIDPGALGLDLTAFVGVTVERPEHVPAFLARLEQLDAVLECHHVAGEESYLLKVRVRGTAELERLLVDELKALPGVVRTRTTVVLSTAKETARLPLPAEASARGARA